MGIKKVYESIRVEVLYNILFEFEMPKKLFGLTKICLIETYSTFQIGKKSL
jgi:hypothetical protein